MRAQRSARVERATQLPAQEPWACCPAELVGIVTGRTHHCRWHSSFSRRSRDERDLPRREPRTASLEAIASRAPARQCRSIGAVASRGCGGLRSSMARGCTRCFQTLVLEAHAGQEGHRDLSIARCFRCSHNPDRGAQSAGPQCHADAVVCACAYGATCRGLVPRTMAPLLDPAQATSAVTIDVSEEQFADICRASPGCAPREHSSRYVLGVKDRSRSSSRSTTSQRRS